MGDESPNYWAFDDSEEEEQPTARAPAPAPPSTSNRHHSDDEGEQRKSSGKKRGRPPKKKSGHPLAVITISSSDDDEPTTLQRSRLADTSKHHTAQPSLPSTGARSAITIPTYGTLPLPTRPVEDEPVTVAPEETMSLATRQNLAKLKQLEEDMKAMQRDLEQDVPSPEPAPFVRRPARRAFVPLAPIVLQPVQPRAAPAEPDDDISAPALAPDADANKITVVLKHKHGEQKIRIKQTDTATKLLHTFLKALDQLKPSWPRPKDVGACKLMFDGDKISPDTTIEDVGIEHGEIFDVSWK